MSIVYTVAMDITAIICLLVLLPPALAAIAGFTSLSRGAYWTWRRR